MDITGISNDINQYVADTQRQQSALGSFQSVLEKSAAQSAAAQESTVQDQEVKEACEAFESYFLQMMFREMRKTSFDENGFLPKSNAEKIFTDLLDEEVSKAATKSGGIGLADMMYKQMTQYRTDLLQPE